MGFTIAWLLLYSQHRCNKVFSYMHIHTQTHGHGYTCSICKNKPHGITENKENVTSICSSSLAIEIEIQTKMNYTRMNIFHGRCGSSGLRESSCYSFSLIDQWNLLAIGMLQLPNLISRIIFQTKTPRRLLWSDNQLS